MSRCRFAVAFVLALLLALAGASPNDAASAEGAGRRKGVKLNKNSRVKMPNLKERVAEGASSSLASDGVAETAGARIAESAAAARRQLHQAARQAGVHEEEPYARRGARFAGDSSAEHAAAAGLLAVQQQAAAAQGGRVETAHTRRLAAEAEAAESRRLAEELAHSERVNAGRPTAPPEALQRGRRMSLANHRYNDCSEHTCPQGSCTFAECDAKGGPDFPPVSCEGGGCTFYRCSSPSCQGGGCKFIECSSPSCPGGGCDFVDTATLLVDGFCGGGGCSIDGFPIKGKVVGEAVL